MTTTTDVTPKRKKKGQGCLIALMVVVIVLAVGLGIGWLFLEKEHREARNLPLNAVDFKKLKDGAYHGAYAGGMYRWRVNACVVTVTNGQVSAIQLASQNPGAGVFDVKMLYDRVIRAQSLQVDTVSGATLTSKAYLQCVENALIQAENK
jgi:uncharacterized protein with FMN-binding domain